MTSMKLTAGQKFPSITVKNLSGGDLNLTARTAPYDWKMIVVYRGKHCPFCTEYLAELKEMVAEFNDVGIDIVAVSADSEERAKIQIAEIQPNFDVGYNLSIPQMQELGLYITTPRSEAESDRPFAEPAFFIVNEHDQTQIVDISNIAFGRPELKTMLRGLKHIRSPGKNYPIRGTYRTP